MKPHIVIVTQLGFRNLGASVHGVYQRFRLLLGAAAAVADVIVLLVPPEPAAAGPDGEAEAQIRAVWGLDVRVFRASREESPRRRWLVEQVLGVIGYRWLARLAGVQTASNSDLLRRLLEGAPLAVIAHRLPMMELVRALAPRSMPVIFDLDDIEHVALQRAIPAMATGRERLFAQAAIPAVRRAEARAFARARFSLVCSEHDRAQLAATLARGRGEVVVIPNSCVMKQRQDVPAEPVLLFVGALSWLPNAQAVEYFLRECWPGLRARIPRARLLVAGKNVEQISCHRNPPDGVELLGFVPDIDACYAAARVVICPVVSGGGTRVKLVEAAAFGKPIVSTTIGAEGLGFADGVEALIADDAATFVDCCARVLSDDQLANRLAQNSHSHADRHFSETRTRQLVQGLIGTATEDARHIS